MLRRSNPTNQRTATTESTDGVVGLLLLAALALPSGVSSQRAAGKAPVSCEPTTCEVHLERVARVTDPVVVRSLPGYSIFVVGEGAGRFLTLTAQRNQIASFDETGRIRLYGTDKPGSRVFFSIIPASAADRRAYVFDALSASVLSLTVDGTLRQVGPFPYTPFFMLANGQFVVAQQIRSAKLAGYPVHVVDGQGNVVRSFGIDVPEFRTDMQRVTTRLAMPASDGTIWTIAPGRYVFEQWNPEDGTRRRRVPVRSPWFVESHSDSSDWTVRPTDVIEAAWEKEGVLWALIRVADNKWNSLLGSPVAERALDPEDYDKRFDSMLEAIDPESGRVLASRRFDRILWGRSSASALLAGRIEGGKTPGIDVWRFGLRAR